MTKTQKLFFSCVESRIQNQGSMYSRFHLGPFYRGQSLTFANAIRRVLLSEIPGIIIKNVLIEGASHEFASLPGVQETVLDILLNIKKLVFKPVIRNFKDLENFQTKAFLKTRGPGLVTAADFKLPPTVKCVNSTGLIATLTAGGELSLCLELGFVKPGDSEKPPRSLNKTMEIFFDTVAMPVQKVNYVIKELDAKNGSEYLLVEIWTDGSVTPHDVFQFALKNLTQLFYQFGELSKT